jgi:hypothetical protein
MIMKKWLVALAAIGSMTCADVDSGVMVQILFVQRPAESTCAYTPESTSADVVGFYDPAGTDGIVVGVTIQNNLAATDEDPVECPGGGTTCQASGNRILIQGFDTCWFKASAAPADTGCDDVSSSQARFVGGSGFIDAGQRGVAGFRALNHEDLGALYGPAFAPFNIPARGIFLDTNDNLIKYTDGPELPHTSGAWGTFPAETSQDSIVLRFRATVKLQDGDTFKSNWFDYPVTICPRCMFGFCAPKVLKQCFERCNGGPCPFNDPLTPQDDAITYDCHVDPNRPEPRKCDSSCGNGVLCNPFDFEGGVVAFGGCAPFQGFSPTGTQCSVIDSCAP